MYLFLFSFALPLFAAFHLTWGVPAISLDSNPPEGDSDYSAFIAIDFEGNGAATWSRTTGSKASEKVWAAIYNEAQRVWMSSFQLSGDGSACNSQVAFDVAGNALFIWEEGIPSRIRYRILHPSGVWTPDLTEQAAEVYPSKNAQSLPQIQMDAKGNALIIWEEFFDEKTHIFSSFKPMNSPCIFKGQISSNDANASLVPAKALTMNRNGQAAAIWTTSDQIELSVFSEENWMAPITLSEKNAISPSIAIDPEGAIVAIWQEENSLFSKKITQQNEVSPLFKVPLFERAAARPHVCMNEQGDAIVVFESSNSLYKFIASSTLLQNANEWNSPVDISGPSPAASLKAGFAVFRMNALGDGVAIWKEWTGSNMIIRGAGRSMGTWSSIQTLSSLDATAAAQMQGYDISVTLNRAGQILAIWPEDPDHNGSQQIKTTFGVGLASSGPLPPVAHPQTIVEGIVSGHQIKHRFPAHQDLINVLTWQSPGGVAHFNIYRNSLSNLIGTATAPSFEDHQRIPKIKETYLITSIDHEGRESTPMTMVVPPK